MSEHCPTLIVEYCQTYFSPDLSQWRSLLDLLLQNCLSAGRPSNIRHPAASPMTVSHSTLTPPLPSHTPTFSCSAVTISTNSSLSSLPLTSTSTHLNLHPPQPPPTCGNPLPPPKLHMFVSLYKGGRSRG